MKKLVNYRPILFFSIALIVGGYAFASAIFHEYVYIIIGSLVLLTIGVGVYFFIKSKDHKILTRILSLGVLPFVVGGIITSSMVTKKLNAFKDCGKYYVVATVASGGVLNGEQSGTLTDVEIRPVSDLDRVIKLDGEYEVKPFQHQEEKNLYVGDRIEFIGTYAYYYETSFEDSPLNSGIDNGVFILNSDYEIVSQGSGVKYTILKWSRDTIYNNMNKREADIAYSMLFGDKSFMDQSLKDYYGISGVAHVLAVSGLHVGFLIMIIGWALSKIIKNKWVYFITVVSILLGYAYICNWTPSIIRAISMFGVSAIAVQFFRQNDGLNALAVASLINFAFMPLDIFNIGFLLSYSVVFSIFAISPILNQIIGEKMPKKVASGLSLSVSAWLGSIPIIIFYFKYISVYAILLNLIVIPFVAVLFVVLVVCMILGVVPAVASFFIAIPEFLIRCLNFLVEGVGSLSTSMITSSISYPILLFGILALIISGDYVFIKRKPMLTAVLAFGFIGFMTIYNF